MDSRRADLSDEVSPPYSPLTPYAGRTSTQNDNRDAVHAGNSASTTLTEDALEQAQSFSTSRPIPEGDAPTIAEALQSSSNTLEGEAPAFSTRGRTRNRSKKTTNNAGGATTTKPPVASKPPVATTSDVTAGAVGAALALHAAERERKKKSKEAREMFGTPLSARELLHVNEMHNPDTHNEYGTPHNDPRYAIYCVKPVVGGRTVVSRKFGVGFGVGGGVVDMTPEEIDTYTCIIAGMKRRAPDPSRSDAQFDPRTGPQAYYSNATGRCHKAIPVSADVLATPKAPAPAPREEEKSRPTVNLPSPMPPRKKARISPSGPPSSKAAMEAVPSTGLTQTGRKKATSGNIHYLPEEQKWLNEFLDADVEGRLGWKQIAEAFNAEWEGRSVGGKPVRPERNAQGLRDMAKGKEVGKARDAWMARRDEREQKEKDQKAAAREQAA